MERDAEKERDALVAEGYDPGHEQSVVEKLSMVVGEVNRELRKDANVKPLDLAAIREDAARAEREKCVGAIKALVIQRDRKDASLPRGGAYHDGYWQALHGGAYHDGYWQALHDALAEIEVAPAQEPAAPASDGLLATARKLASVCRHALHDMDSIDELCRLAGAHPYTLMRAELEQALASPAVAALARGEGA